MLQLGHGLFIAMLRKDAWASVTISLGWLNLMKRTDKAEISDLADRSLQGQKKKVPSTTVHPKDEAEVHPVASTCFRSFHSHINIVNTYFAKKCTRSVKAFHFHADPRVR